MTCSRCIGLMLAAYTIPTVSDPAIPVWRCLNCGFYLDPLIRRHRLMQSRDVRQLRETPQACAEMG